MHKMLEDYLTSYKNFSNRDQLLLENEEYSKICRRISSLEEEIILLLKNVDSKEEARKLINDLDALFWKKLDIMEKDAYELGFNAGLKIATDVYSTKRIIDSE